MSAGSGHRLEPDGWCRPIGVVVSSLKTRAEAPKQGPPAALEAVIELEPGLVEGLTGLEPGRWLWVIYRFHRIEGHRLLVHPRGDPDRPLTGVFNTRAPVRPCPLGLTLVRLTAREGGRLFVRGLEAVDGSPVLDIKPYSPEVDSPQEQEHA